MTPTTHDDLPPLSGLDRLDEERAADMEYNRPRYAGGTLSDGAIVLLLAVDVPTRARQPVPAMTPRESDHRDATPQPQPSGEPIEAASPESVNEQERPTAKHPAPAAVT